MRITIELDPLARPMTGWFQAGCRPRREFEGMIELISLLESVRGEPRNDLGVPEPAGPNEG